MSNSITVRFVVGEFAGNFEQHGSLQIRESAQSAFKRVDVEKPARAGRGNPHVFIFAAKASDAFLNPANSLQLGNNIIEGDQLRRFFRREIIEVHAADSNQPFPGDKKIGGQS